MKKQNEKHLKREHEQSSMWKESSDGSHETIPHKNVHEVQVVSEVSLPSVDVLRLIWEAPLWTQMRLIFGYPSSDTKQNLQRLYELPFFIRNYEIDSCSQIINYNL